MDKEIFKIFDLLFNAVENSDNFNSGDINFIRENNIFEVKIYRNDVPKDNRTKPNE